MQIGLLYFLIPLTSAFSQSNCFGEILTLPSPITDNFIKERSSSAVFVFLEEKVEMHFRVSLPSKFWYYQKWVFLQTFKPKFCTLKAFKIEIQLLYSNYKILNFLWTPNFSFALPQKFAIFRWNTDTYHIFRCLPGKQNGFTSGSFKTVLLVNNLIQTGQEENLFITGDDVQKCKKIAKQKKGSIFSLLSKSLAPSIHGHEYVKKALLCLLLGGVEKVTEIFKS